MFCNYCGVPNPDDASFCRACGKRTAVLANESQTHREIDASSTSGSGAAATVAAPPEVRQSPAENRKGGPVLWTLAGVVLVAVLLVAFTINVERSRPASSDETSSGSASPPPSYSAPPAVPAPAPVDAPPAQPEAASTAVPAAPPAPPPVPQNPIAGEWKTTTLIGDSYLELTAEGRYRIKNALVEERGVYVFSSDGDLRLQQD